MSKFFYAALNINGVSAKSWRTEDGRRSYYGGDYNRTGNTYTLVSDSEITTESPVVAIERGGELTPYVVVGPATAPAKLDGLPLVVSGALDLTAYDKAQADIKRRVELRADLDSRAAQWAELEKYAKLAEADPTAKAKVKELAALMGLTFPAK